MNVARNTTHGLRHDRISLTDERGKLAISLLTCRNEIYIDVTLNGQRHEGYVSARRLAEILTATSSKQGEIK